MNERDLRIKALEMAIEACGITTSKYILDTANKFLDFIYNNEKITKEEKKQILLEFCKYIMIDHPKHGVIPLELYDFQKDMLDKFQQKKSIITITHARQMGATTMLSIYALWYALYYDNSNIWLFNPKYDLAVNQINIICEMLSNINDIDGYNKAINMISFKNGSRIFAGGISDTTYRGSTLDLAIIDNASQIPYSKDKKFIESLIPCCATSNNGSIILASALGLEPKGLFHDMAKKHVNYVYPWHLHPEKNDEWEDRMKSSIGEIAWQREHNCSYENIQEQPDLEILELVKEMNKNSNSIPNRFTFKETHPFFLIKHYDNINEEPVLMDSNNTKRIMIKVDDIIDATNLFVNFIVNNPKIETIKAWHRDDFLGLLISKCVNKFRTKTLDSGSSLIDKIFILASPLVEKQVKIFQNNVIDPYIKIIYDINIPINKVILLSYDDKNISGPCIYSSGDLGSFVSFENEIADDTSKYITMIDIDNHTMDDKGYFSGFKYPLSIYS